MNQIDLAPSRRVLASAVAVVCCLAGPPVAAAQDLRVTEQDVTPILLLRCTVCHGHRRAEAGLDLRTRAAMLRGGKSGPAIVAGKPEASLMLQRIVAGEMPPPPRLVEVSVKPMEPGEVELVRRWIAQGAPESPANDDADAAGTDRLVTDADRRFWSFQPPRPVAIPPLPPGSPARNPIDSFVLDALQASGLSPAAPAERRTLLRRAYFDLVGLPPPPHEIDRFESDTDPRAYEKLIDRLLASPHYGERWGRYWLDLAGYSDSEGVQHSDPIRPNAYRYRDYVIRSFNSDKPYDRFLLEQLAGDELADYESAREITPEIYDNLVATGFLRMAPDGTFSGITGFVPDRLDVISAEIEVLSSAVMGLTLRCARCHSHKFDPIPQRDYYRLAAIFKGAFDEHDWLKPNDGGQGTRSVLGTRDLPHVLPQERQAWLAQQQQLDEQVRLAQAELERRAAAAAARYQQAKIAALPAVLHDDLRRMLATPPERRDTVLQYLAGKFEKTLLADRAELAKLDPEFQKAAGDTDRRLAELQAQRRPEPKVRALWDRGTPSPTYLLKRGNYLAPGPVVAPGLPAVLSDAGNGFRPEPPWPGSNKTGRRLAFARWLTRPDHPLTARVMVNRIWKHHFGRGLVPTLDNFGKTGAPPSHPELLDWLAIEFTRQGWSVKAMHRLIMTSSTYRQSSQVEPQRVAADPDNRWLARMPLRRLDAEAIYDSLMQLAGQLDGTPFGPADAVDVDGAGVVTARRTATGWRRSIYVQQRRTEMPTFLETFDLPRMGPNCVERPESTVAPQALHLMNNRTVHELAGWFARRVVAEAGRQPDRQIEHAYRVALGRPPSPAQRQLAATALARLAAEWERSRPAGSPEKANPYQAEAADHALANFCHALMNSAELLYVD
jgi:hypothetical protein